MSAQAREGTMTDEATICRTCGGTGQTYYAADIQTEHQRLLTLRAAVLRYGRALQQVRGRDGSIVDAAGYDEWCAALEVLDALALALAAEEGPG